MKKVRFSWYEGYNDIREEIIEFEDNATEEDIEKDYTNWLFEMIEGRTGWEIIE